MRFSSFLLAFLLFMTFLMLMNFHTVFMDLYNRPFSKIDMDNYIRFQHTETDFIHFFFTKFMDGLPLSTLDAYIWVLPFVCFIVYPLVLGFLFSELCLLDGYRVDVNWVVILTFFGSFFFLDFLIVNILAQYFSMVFWFLGLAFFIRFIRLGLPLSRKVMYLCFVMMLCFHPRMGLVLFLFIVLEYGRIRHLILLVLLALLVFGYTYSVLDEIVLDKTNYNPFVWLFMLVNPFILLGCLWFLDNYKCYFKFHILIFCLLGFVSHNGRLLPFIIPLVCFYGYLFLRRLSFGMRLGLFVFGVFWFLHVYGFFMEQLVVELSSERGLDGTLFLNYLLGK